MTRTKASVAGAVSGRVRGEFHPAEESGIVSRVKPMISVLFIFVIPWVMECNVTEFPERGLKKMRGFLPVNFSAKSRMPA